MSQQFQLSEPKPKRGCLARIGIGLLWMLGILIVLIVIAGVFANSNTGRPAAPSGPQTNSDSVNVQQPVATLPTFDASNWSLLDADPDAYQGAQVEIVGKAFGKPEHTESATFWQMWSSPVDSAWNTGVKLADPKFVIEDGDFVRIKGIVIGKREGKNAFGATIRMTLIEAQSAEAVDALAAAPPAIRTVELNQETDQHGLLVKIVKVEFAAIETRVHVVVHNATTDEATFFDSSAKVTQGQRQFEREYSSNYPRLQSSLLPNIETAGVIVFPAMDPNVKTTLYLEGHTSDYSIKFDPYVFEVPAAQ